MSNLDQGNFNFDADGDSKGYANWQQELGALKRKLERKHGIILGTRVSLTLKQIDRPTEGIITLAPNQPRDKTEPLLRISSLTRLTFHPSDICSVTRL